MRRKVLPFILGGALAVAAVAPAAAANHTNQLEVGQVGGAAGLVAAVVQVQATLQDVTIVDRSLNNLLRNADIDVLNNVLNNLLRDADIDITRVISDNEVVVSVLSGGVNLGDITVTSP